MRERETIRRVAFLPPLEDRGSTNLPHWLGTGWSPHPTLSNIYLISFDVLSVAHAHPLQSFLLPKFEATKVARAGLPTWPEVENEGKEIGVEDKSDRPCERKQKTRRQVSRERGKRKASSREKKERTFANCG